MNPTEQLCDDIIGDLRWRIKLLRRLLNQLQLSDESLRALETADAEVRAIRWELRDVMGERQVIGD